MDENDEIAWIDGQILPASEARIPVLDHGFLFGDGVFEGIRLTPNGVFRFEDHMQRLAIASRAVGIEPEGGFEAVREVVREIARAFGARHGYLRLIMTRGVGALGIDPASCPRPGIFCLAAGPSKRSAEKNAAGISMVTSSWRRPSADMLDPRVKSLNYLNNVLAKREANLGGADDALVLNHLGLVAEASAANIFALKGEVLRTPPVTDGALEGITRRTVLEIAAELGFMAEERSLGRFDLYAADAVFLTGTRAGVVPVASLDGSPISQQGRAGADRIRETFESRLEALSTPV